METVFTESGLKFSVGTRGGRDPGRLHGTAPGKPKISVLLIIRSIPTRVSESVDPNSKLGFFVSIV